MGNRAAKTQSSSLIWDASVSGCLTHCTTTSSPLAIVVLVLQIIDYLLIFSTFLNHRVLKKNNFINLVCLVPRIGLTCIRYSIISST